MNLFYFIVLIAQIRAENIQKNVLTKFLLDFFEVKNVSLTLNLCWNKGEINDLTIQLFKLPYFKQTTINTNFTNTDFLNYTEHDNYVVVDISCPDSDNILLKANKFEKYLSPNKWLLIQSNLNIENSVDIYTNVLNKYLIQVDSELVCAENFKNNEILLWLYYKVNENRTLYRELLGTWKPKHGIQIQLSHNISSFRRKNLEGSTIRIASVMNDLDTMNNLGNYKYPMIDTITKTQYGILMSLIEYLNASFHIIRADQWGIIEDYETERWGGMCGFIQRKEADISGTAMFFFKRRLKIGKFLKLTNPSTIQFIFRKPPLSIEQNIYSLPFSSNVWISSVLIILLITLLLILSSYFENPRNQENEKVGFGNIILLMAAAVCQQGCDVVPSGVPGRTLTLFVFTAFMFLYVSYSANIVALLQSSSESIKSMEDLLKSKNMKVGCHNISYNYQYFQNATERVRKAIYKEKIGLHGYYELQEGVEKIRQGLFAFHVEEGSANYYILKTFEEHEKCDTDTMPGVFDAQLGWHASRSNSPHTELFKIGLYKIGEYGIERRYFLRFYRRIKCYYSSASFTSVGITDFYPALLIFTYGLMCSIFIFLMEHLHYYYKKKNVTFTVNTVKENIAFVSNTKKPFGKWP